ncbi:MAG: condensation domain-containing protein [Actinomycetes bacterium]
MSGVTTTGPGGRDLGDEAVATVFADVLDHPTHAPDLSLLAAGGTSLHAIRIAQRLSRLTGVTVPVVTVLRHPSPTSLAQALAREAPGAPQPPVPTQPIVPGTVERWPLPSPQRRIWALHERDPQRLDHLVTVSLELGGRAFPLPPQALIDVWAAIVDRHPTMRMRVCDAHELTAVADGVGAGLQFLDTAALPDFLADDIVAEEIGRIRRQPFDLRAGPVARGLLVRRRDGTLTLDLVIHHIACDGWSLRVLLDELFESASSIAYGSPNPRSAPNVRYTDFAAWEEQANTRWPDHLRRSEGDLLPVPDRLVLPHVSDPEPREATEVALGKDRSWAARLQAAFAAHAYSPLVIGLVAVAVTLNRTSGQDAFYLAVPVANRPPGFEAVVGDFVNTSIVRIDLGGTNDVQDVLDRAAAQVARVYEIQDLPFEQLTSHLRRHAPTPDAVLPRVALTVQNFERQRGVYADGQLTVTWNEVAERESKYDVVVTMDTVELDQALLVTCDPRLINTGAATALLRRIDQAIDLVLLHLGM